MAKPAPVAAGAGAEAEFRFEDFFRDHYRPLAQASLLLTGDPAEAEDLAQEAMCRVFERWEQVREMESPQGYVYRTALNLHRKRLRWQAVRERLRFWGRQLEPDPADVIQPRDSVNRILRSLTAEQREALVLVDWLGLSSEEAGTVLGIDPASVRGRIHRGRAAARRRFADGSE